jgi:hypothetical protein
MMEKFKKNLSQLIRKEMGLSSKTEAEILSIINSQQSPGKIIRYLTYLCHIKILWTFPVVEQVHILESVCAELSHSARSDLFIRLITVVFRHSSRKEDDTSGVKNFVSFTKMYMGNETNFTVKAGLALVMVMILKTYPQLISNVEVKELTPSLLFVNDNVSYAAVFNNLIAFFGARRVIPLVIDLLIEHPHKTNLFLTNTLIEHAIKLSRHQKVAVFDKLKIFLMTQKDIVGEEKVSRLYRRFIVALGRNYFLTNTLSSPTVIEKAAKRTSNVRMAENKRFSLLQQMKGG